MTPVTRIFHLPFASVRHIWSRYQKKTEYITLKSLAVHIRMAGARQTWRKSVWRSRKNEVRKWSRISAPLRCLYVIVRRLYRGMHPLDFFQALTFKAAIVVTKEIKKSPLMGCYPNLCVIGTCSLCSESRKRFSSSSKERSGDTSWARAVCVPVL